MPHTSTYLPSCLRVLVVISALSCPAFSQKAPQNEDPVRILTPTVDKATHTVTIPGAFWNEKLADWIEVALSGRPSDFLHETLICTTTTRTLLESALRDAGFHDADAWVPSVQDFPAIRGDRILILLTFTPEKGGQPQTFSLDELIAFPGWNTSVGPYGFMFRGDPEHTRPAPVPGPATEKTTPAPDSPRIQILRDDPQIALAFKGLQSMSQSFADHPLAYLGEDWIYPMMELTRNYSLLPSAVFDSNGDIPVTIIFQKVTEEELLRRSAQVWHDKAAVDNILSQLPAAREIDTDKAALWSLIPALQKHRAAATQPAETRDIPAEDELLGTADLLASRIAKNYATLDAAWASFAADHALFKLREGDDPSFLNEMHAEAARWRTHNLLLQSAAGQTARASGAAYQLQQLSHQPQTDATRLQSQHLRGQEIAARSAALRASNTESADYWKAQRARIDPALDPRTDWLKEIDLQLELTAARDQAALLGQNLGDVLSNAPLNDSSLTPLQSDYANALLRIQRAQLELQLADINFEIAKREGLQDLPGAGQSDPDLPALRARKARLQQQLQSLPSAPSTSQPRPPNK